MKVNEFDIAEIPIASNNRVKAWQVRQFDNQNKGFWKRKEFEFGANNANNKKNALDQAIEYSKNATPYE